MDQSGSNSNSEIIESGSARETYLLGRAIGKKAQPGDVCALIGDLGCGKTVFTQGVAAGLRVVEPVVSPTFTILHEYESGRMPFYHFDVYRIGDPAQMEEVGYDEYIDGSGLCLIEWAELIEEILPPSYLRITIEKDLARGFDYRRIKIENIGGKG